MTQIILNKHNVLLIIACFIPTYLVIGGMIVFPYLNMDYSPLAVVISFMATTPMSFLNLKAVMKRESQNYPNVKGESD